MHNSLNSNRCTLYLLAPRVKNRKCDTLLQNAHFHESPNIVDFTNISKKREDAVYNFVAFSINDLVLAEEILPTKYLECGLKKMVMDI